VRRPAGEHQGRRAFARDGKCVCASRATALRCGRGLAPKKARSSRLCGSYWSLDVTARSVQLAVGKSSQTRAPKHPGQHEQCPFLRRRHGDSSSSLRRLRRASPPDRNELHAHQSRARMATRSLERPRGSSRTSVALPVLLDATPWIHQALSEKDELGCTGSCGKGPGQPFPD
jgi:hypothetical protein